MSRGHSLLKTAAAAMPFVIAAALALNLLDRASPLLGFASAVALLAGLLVFLYLVGTRVK